MRFKASDAPRALFTCLGEDEPLWHERVLNLLLSLRTFGGRQAQAPFVACFVGGVDETARRLLERLEAEVRVVQPVKGLARHANKLRMLEMGSRTDFDVLVALDCDVVITGDVSPWLGTKAIGLKPVDVDPFVASDWRRLHRALGVPDPGELVRATSTGRMTRPYFNSGVITVPRALCDPLSRAWTESLNAVVGALESEPGLLPAHLKFFTDQLALAFALQRSGLPWAELPVQMNFPTHIEVHGACSGAEEPAVLHYHSHVDDDGFLVRPVAAAADRVADAFNVVLAEFSGSTYEGMISMRGAESGPGRLAKAARSAARSSHHRTVAWSRRMAGRAWTRS